jgi:hypothetical protein
MNDFLTLPQMARFEAWDLAYSGVMCMEVEGDKVRGNRALGLATMLRDLADNFEGLEAAMVREVERHGKMRTLLKMVAEKGTKAVSIEWLAEVAKSVEGI